MHPLFSVVIPTFNRASLVGKAIESVFNQSFGDWELIIVDDGSTDNTKEIVESFKDGRVKYIYQKNTGRSSARNTGIDQSNGFYICFLDSDDYYLSNHLSVLCETIINRNYPIAFICTGIYTDKKNTLNELPIFEPDKFKSPVQFIWEKFILPDAVCIHNSLLKTNKFLENYKSAVWEDTHLWLRLAAKYEFIQINAYTTALVEHEARSVTQAFTKVKLSAVKDYRLFVEDLFLEHYEIISKYLSNNDKRDYIDSKYKMFLYQSRQNRQFIIALVIWLKATLFKPSFYLFSEFPKIFINLLGFGLHRD